MSNVIRTDVSQEDLANALQAIKNKLNDRIRKKGSLSYIGNHEAYGVIAEEFIELGEVIREDDDEIFLGEIVDIAVGCIFTLASQSAYNRESKK